MEQHPVPRQITTFEFKLIGFLTLKQFLYLVVALPSAFIAYKLIPVPLINIIVAALMAIGGIVFAVVPIQDRPMDIWIKNLIKRLNSPTQYYYQKHNTSLYFLKELYFMTDPHKIMAHVESKEKLAAYLAQRRAGTATAGDKQKQHIQELLKQQTPNGINSNLRISTPSVVPTSASVAQKPQAAPTSGPIMQVVTAGPQAPGSAPVPSPGGMKTPFFIGVVRNSKQTPLPNMMIYVKDMASNPLRLLKSNLHGVFATYNPLPPADYVIEIKDPNGGYFFDTMKVRIANTNPTPFEFYSKELL